MDAKTFFEKYAAYAVDAYKKEGILASLTLAQAYLESGEGESELAAKYNNFFGIKGRGSQGSITLPTKEWNGKEMVTVNAAFAYFANPLESFEAHIQLFKNGVSWARNKYKNLFGVKDYKVACRLVQKDGYATDPNYTTKLIDIIEKYGLEKYDKDTEQKKVAEEVTADYAIVPRKHLMSLGITDGSKPTEAATRQQVWTFIDRALNHFDQVIEKLVDEKVKAKIDEMFPKNLDESKLQTESVTPIEPTPIEPTPIEPTPTQPEPQQEPQQTTNAAGE